MPLEPAEARNIVKVLSFVYGQAMVWQRAYARALSDSCGLPFEQIEQRAREWIEIHQDDKVLEALREFDQYMREMGFVRDPKSPL